MNTQRKLLGAWRALIEVMGAFAALKDMTTLESKVMKQALIRDARTVQALAGEYARELEEEADGS